MATYGRGQMLGTGIDPRMFVQDYSGFANAGAIQGQGMAQLGADIGDIGKQFGEFKKQQAEQEKQVKSAELVAKAISDSFPSLAPMAQEAMFILGDKNNPLSDRLAAARAIEKSLKIGSGLLAQQQNAQLASQKMAMQMEEQQRSANEIVAVENIYRGNEEIQMGRTRGGQLVPVGQMVQNALPQDKTLQPLPTSMETEADRQGRAVEINNETDAAPMVLPIGDRTEEQIKDEDAISRSIGEQPTLGVRPRYRESTQQQQEIVLLSPAQVQDIIAKGGKVSGDVLPDGGVSNAKVTYGGAPLVNVSNAPTPATGYQNVFDEQGNLVKQEPIPGGPADVKEKSGKESEEKQRKYQLEIANRSLKSIDSLMEKADKMSEMSIAGPIRKGLSALGASEQADIQADISQLVSATQIETLQQMKQQSITGASGLGQINMMEFQALADIAGALRLEMRPSSLKKHLNEYKTRYLNVVYGTPEERTELVKSGRISEQENNAINAKYPGGEPPESALSPEFQEQRRNWRERSKQ